jgi:hypothetical protein
MSAHGAGGDRATAFFTSIVAVLAAVGTLFATHRSIGAISVQTQGLRFAQMASDQYAYYQTDQMKATLYRVNHLNAMAQAEDRNSLQIFARAKALELQSSQSAERADALLESFERLEIATTFFEIAIAFASIGVLTHLRVPLWASGVLAVIGVGVGLTGYLLAH